jgi:O-antigen/teichoic acid export membrane protein
MASLTRDFGATFVSRILLLLTGIGVEVCLAWFLKPAGRGSYAVCIIFAGVLQILFAAGCNVTSVYFVASKRMTLSEGVTQTLLYGGISATLAVVAGILIMNSGLSYFDGADAKAFWMALALIPTGLFSTAFLQLLTAVHDFRGFAIVCVVQGISLFLLVLVFVGVLSWGMHGALLANILRNCLVMLVAVLCLCQRHSLSWHRPSLKGLCDMYHYGLRYHAGQIASNVNVQAGTMVLAMFATTAEVGLLAVASQLMTKGVMVIPETMMTVLLPKAAEDETGRPLLVARCARLTGVICGILLLSIVVFATPMVRLLFSPSFLPAVPLVQILAVGTFVRCICKVFTPYLQGRNHPGVESLGVVLGVTVNILVLWLLLPVIGLPAAALGMTLSYITSSIVVTLGFMRYSNLGSRRIFRLTQSDWATTYKVVTQLLPQLGDKRVLS